MAKLADAIDLGSIGQPWGFKSLYPHQKSRRGFAFPAFFRTVVKGLERDGSANMRCSAYSPVPGVKASRNATAFAKNLFFA